jgi:hypothetical protein
VVLVVALVLVLVEALVVVLVVGLVVALVLVLVVVLVEERLWWRLCWCLWWGLHRTDTQTATHATMMTSGHDSYNGISSRISSRQWKLYRSLSDARTCQNTAFTNNTAPLHECAGRAATRLTRTANKHIRGLVDVVYNKQHLI